MRSKNKLFVFFILMSVLSTTILVETKSQFSTITVFVDPPSVVVDQTVSSFTIKINVSDVSGLNNWHLKMRYNPVLLYTNSSLIKPGAFCNYPGSIFLSYFEADYLQIDWLIPFEDWVDGKGTLAQITYRVKGKGETILDLYDTRLGDASTPPTFFDHLSQDGYFRNVDLGQAPVASFDHLPIFPLWYENVTFDASASYDPDGSITHYVWFFGGLSGDENFANVTDPIIYHQYKKLQNLREWNATVRLLVIDNTGTTGNLSVKVLTVVSSRVLHDLAIIPPSVSPFNSTNIEPDGTLQITVLVENQGDSSETFNATTYYRRIGIDEWTPIATQTDITLNASNMRPLKFNWNTAGMVSGVYTIRAWVPPSMNETDTLDNTCILGNVTVTFAPRVSFVYEPVNPYVDEGIVFNASASYDPDGTITSYSWDFGEWILNTQGNVTTTIDPLVVHSYAVGFTYFVTLTVRDNLGATGFQSQWINVSKLSSEISLNMSRVVTVGLNTAINGSIAPVPSRAKVSILYRLFGEDVWSSLVNTTTNAQGEFSGTWAPTSSGTFEFKAKWDGDQKYYGDESDVLVVAAKFSSSISLSVTPSNVTLGESVVIAGLISPIRSGASVSILYSVDEGSWSLIGNTTTSQTGYYFYSWKPLAVGVYRIKTMWVGDEITYGGESDVVMVEVVEEAGAFDYRLYFVVAAIAAVVVVTIFLLRFRKRH